LNNSCLTTGSPKRTILQHKSNPNSRWSTIDGYEQEIYNQHTAVVNVTPLLLKTTVQQAAKILLVEDNHVNRRVAHSMLSSLGYEADDALNGLEAVLMLERSSYDLVLMDCQMPEMDGYEATAKIRSMHSSVLDHDIIVIAMTANCMAGDREKCLDAGMNDYLAKPVKKKLLAEVLERWLPVSSR
jgi:two-component system, sensor histidine kinase and response regulator